MQTALAGVEARNAREAAEEEGSALQAALAQFTAQHSSGYFEVHRTGPSDLPPLELGNILKIKVSELGKLSIEELVEQKLGGGEYFVQGRRRDHTPVHSAHREFSIGGCEPKVRTQAGRRWLKQYLGEETAPAPNNDASLRLAEKLLERAPQPGGDTAGLVAMMNLMIDQQRQSAERDRLAAERRAEEDRKADEDRRKRFEADERERSRQRDDDAKARVAQIEAQAKKELEEIRQRGQREIEETKLKFQYLTAQLDSQRTREVELAKLSAGGALGLEGLTEIRKQIGALLVDQVKDQIAGGPEESKGWADVAKEVVAKDGGTIVKGLIELLRPSKGAAPAPAPMQRRPGPRPLTGPPPAGPRVPQPLPGAPPASSAEPSGTGADVDVESAPTEPDEAAAAGTDLVPTAPAVSDATSTEDDSVQLAPARDVVRQLTTQKIAVRTAAFMRALVSEMLMQSSPAAAWAADQGGTSLEEIFETLTGPQQLALQQGFEPLAALCPPACTEDVELIREALTNDAGQRWLAAFLESGPWTDGEEGDEGPD